MKIKIIDSPRPQEDDMHTDPANEETTAEELREKIQLNTTYIEQLKDINRLLLKIIENEEKTGIYEHMLAIRAEREGPIPGQGSPP